MGERRRCLCDAEVDAYDVLPRSLAARVRVVTVPFLPRGTSGLTLGRFVLVTDDRVRDGGRQLLAHELVHVRQYAEQGFVPFLARYLTAYLRNVWRLRDHDAAYRAIPAEVQAYAEAAAWLARRSATHGGACDATGA